MTIRGAIIGREIAIRAMIGIPGQMCIQRDRGPVPILIIGGIQSKVVGLIDFV